MKARLAMTVGLGVASFGLAVGAAASPPVAPGPPATADALAVQVVGPDASVIAASTESVAPPGATSDGGGFAYPEDGSIVTVASTSVSVSASAVDGTAASAVELTGVSLFGGEITADDVLGSASSAGTVGDVSDSAITNLTVLGAAVPAVPNSRVPLADWGYAVLLGESTTRGPTSTPSWRGTVTGLVVHLDVDHAGLTAGSEIRLGFADAYSRPPEASATEPTTTQAAPRTTTQSAAPRPHVPPPVGAGAGAGAQSKAKHAKKRKERLVIEPPVVTPKLTAGGYVFPVYGPSGYSDTFGGPRADVSGGWHHGDDVFAPLGAPVLAVSSGTVFSVGWNDIGGWRLWLRDGAGNEFYYAHLSAYTRLAVNGTHVRAGQVLGFVGNTGDALGTPFHLHFEIHPVGMLFLGYDGAVDPTRYLDAWKRLDDVRILPAVPFSAPQAEVSNAPAPGAILLDASDISTANGLDPGSLRRAMRGQPTIDVTQTPVGQLPTPLPELDRA